ncbi:hypothetical protein, partial [Pseudoramibacter alactolyticus]|uniref:hypothetical protein n=1 Tax=Pseudoramibacter alactolyticus TaxID=113287 RepID=UPI00308102B8
RTSFTARFGLPAVTFDIIVNMIISSFQLQGKRYARKRDRSRQGRQQNRCSKKAAIQWKLKFKTLTAIKLVCCPHLNRNHGNDPTDFLTYSRLSFFKSVIRLMASLGFPLKYGLLVQILKPAVTALLV